MRSKKFKFVAVFIAIAMLLSSATTFGDVNVDVVDERTHYTSQINLSVDYLAVDEVDYYYSIIDDMLDRIIAYFFQNDAEGRSTRLDGMHVEYTMIFNIALPLEESVTDEISTRFAFCSNPRLFPINLEVHIRGAIGASQHFALRCNFSHG
ncbi:MAG: hypothetical protein FWE44_03200 [Defluviitaleaceae bacterium]|nr:hypothetical protein [Defluviitaleaceae bacterium]